MTHDEEGFLTYATSASEHWYKVIVHLFVILPSCAAYAHTHVVLSAKAIKHYLGYHRLTTVEAHLHPVAANATYGSKASRRRSSASFQGYITVAPAIRQFSSPA